MGTLDLNYTQVALGDQGFNALSEEECSRFSVSMLALGEVSKESKVTNALAVIFDLEGFTAFCNQLDPHLVVPEYLSEFLPWLFDDIVQQFSKEKREGKVLIWGALPFFAKFTGDGVLFLWNTDLCKGLMGVGNVVGSLRQICDDYETVFLPRMEAAHSKVPRRLRVGICRGQVLSIGDGQDYVGPCINMASRLQKLGSLSFAISRRGFDPAQCMPSRARQYVIKKASIRDIGDEFIVIRADEYESLPAKEKKLFT